MLDSTLYGAGSQSGICWIAMSIPHPTVTQQS